MMMVVSWRRLNKCDGGGGEDDIIALVYQRRLQNLCRRAII